MGRTLALTACLVAATLMAWFGQRLPHPRPLDAPAEVFSAARAMADVRAIARAPHPVGSPANAQVRDYLVRRMTGLGLAPRIQRDQAVQHDERGGAVRVAGADVENVIGVLPGRDRAAPAVAIEAHYDSVAGSPGAADDAAGVAAALEIVRALKAHGQPARDVVLLITDGEEAGLFGAKAFYDRDPLARRVGFVLNMEARGSAGRAQMFQTGAGNGETIALFRRTAVHPSASSLAVYLYENMPNDTDFTEARRTGVGGLNYAFIGRPFDYHAASATPANLNQGALQDLGRQVLAAARAAAFDPALPARAPDVVFAQTLGDHILAYAPAMGWIAIGLAALLLGVAVWRARRAQAWAWLDFAQGLGVALYLLAGAATLLRLARRATGVDFGFQEQRPLLAEATRFEAGLLLVGVGLALYAASSLARGKMRLAAAGLVLAAGAACSAFGGSDVVGLGLGVAGAALGALVFLRAANAPGAWAGLLTTGLIVAVALQVAAPATAFLVAWPLVLATVAAALSGLAVSRRPPLLAAEAALGALGLAWLGGFAHAVYLGLDMPELLAVFVWLAAMLIWPLAHPKFAGAGRLTAFAVLLAGLAVVISVRLHEPWSPRFPQEIEVVYHQDVDTGLAHRVSLTPDVPAWARAVLTADGGEIARRVLPPLWTRAVTSAPARPVTVVAPALALTRRPDGLVELTATAPPGARILALNLRSATPVTAATLNGQPAPILAKPGQWTRLRWEGAAPKMVVTFRPAGPGAVDTTYGAVAEAWPADAKPLPARPAEVMAYDISDATVAAGARTLSW